MNVLKQEKKIQVLNALIEGCSIRSVERMTGIHRDTIMRLGVEVGAKCAYVLDQKLTNLNVQEAEIDEIWCYVDKSRSALQRSTMSERLETNTPLLQWMPGLNWSRRISSASVLVKMR